MTLKLTSHIIAANASEINYRCRPPRHNRGKPFCLAGLAGRSFRAEPGVDRHLKAPQNRTAIL